MRSNHPVTKGERTRQLIIERAAPLFNKNGYAGTSLSDIMKATGLAKGGLYGNFSSKDEIAAQAFDYAHNKIRTGLLEKLSRCRTHLAKLLAVLDFYHNYTARPPIEGGCPFLNTSVEADDSFPFLKKRARDAQNEMMNSLTALFEEARKAGELKGDIKPRREAEMMYAQIEGGIVMAKINDNPHILNRILSNIRERLTRDLKP